MFHRKNKLFKKIAIIALCVIIFIYGGASIGGAIAGMTIAHLPLDENLTPKSVGIDYKDVSFASRIDSITLKGWYLPASGHTAIIVVHGGLQNRIDENVNTLGLARDLVSSGNDVLLFDMRGRGESDGKGVALSNIEEDLGGAYDFVISQGISPENIFFLAFSSGAAATCIYASQHELPAIIVDGCFNNLREVVKKKAELIGIPAFLVDIYYPGVTIATRLFYDYTVIDPIDIIGDIVCPIFFIYEELDDTITLEDTKEMYRKSINPKSSLWVVEDTLHSQSYLKQPHIYIEKINGFIDSVDED